VVTMGIAIVGVLAFAFSRWLKNPELRSSWLGVGVVSLFMLSIGVLIRLVLGFWP